ncbi:uncharacterized protein AAEQ78_025625 [Lycaon pictus]
MQRPEVAPWAASSPHRMTQAPPVPSGSLFRLDGAWESTGASPRPHWGQDRPRRTLERLCAPGFPGPLCPAGLPLAALLVSALTSARPGPGLRQRPGACPQPPPGQLGPRPRLSGLRLRRLLSGPGRA